ncbi:VWA domain-containing protein [Oribacterium sp. HCP28S3_H8]|uniref:VWA domain-containing protein n=1 Tax=Oribacterium sp. HCP28S3_H8 TaxID=3438945 RepID=UPI003F8A9310
MERRAGRSMKQRARKSLAGILTLSLCLAPLQGVSFADSRTVVGDVEISGRNVTLNLSGADVLDAAMQALADGNLYTDDELAAAKDPRVQADFAALTDGTNPLYEMNLFSEEEQQALAEAGVEVRALIQMDAERAFAGSFLERATESDITKRGILFQDVEEELLLYRDGSNFAGFYQEFANNLYHHTEEIAEADTAGYEINGDEIVTLLFKNYADETRNFHLTLNGETLVKHIKVPKTETAIKGILGALHVEGIEETLPETVTETLPEALPETTPETTKESMTEAAPASTESAGETENTNPAGPGESLEASKDEHSGGALGPAGDMQTGTETATDQPSGDADANAGSSDASQTGVENTTDPAGPANPAEPEKDASGQDKPQENQNTDSSAQQENPGNENAGAENHNTEHAATGTNGTAQAKSENTGSGNTGSEHSGNDQTAGNGIAEQKSAATGATEAVAEILSSAVESIEGNLGVIEAKATERSTAIELSGDTTGADPADRDAAEPKGAEAEDEADKADKAQQNDGAAPESSDTAEPKAAEQNSGDQASEDKSNIAGSTGEAASVEASTDASTTEDNTPEANAPETSAVDPDATGKAQEDKSAEAQENAQTLDPTGTGVSGGSVVNGTEAVPETTAEAIPQETVKPEMELELEDYRRELLAGAHAADLVSSDTVSTKVLQYRLRDLVDLNKKQKLELIYQGPDYTIHVYYTKEAQIPENAELMVREIEEGTEEYGQYYTETLQQLGLMPSLEPIEGETEATPWDPAVDKTRFVPFARYFDVKIMSEDTEIQPAVPVEIQVTYDTPVELPENAEQKAVHFAASGTEVLEAQADRIGSSEQASANASDPADTVAAENFAFVQSSFSVTSTIITNVPKEEEGTAEFTMLRSAPADPTKPTTVKTVTPEENGLYKIRLDLTGRVNTTTEVSKANVIIVFDRSGSMTYYDPTRLAAAKKATNDVAKSLLDLNTSEHPDLVELALISFSTTARVNIAKTTKYKEFSDAVNKIKADGGTNWEDALKKASTVNFDWDGDATYVIFVSDGNPTFRNTKGGYKPLDYNLDYYPYVYGTGDDNNTTTVQRCYDEAKDDAKALVDSHWHFYTIGVFGNVSRMQSLTNYAYSGSDDNNTSAGDGHYFAAADAKALSQALSKIAQAITNSLGFSKVSVQDGVTQHSSISANVPDGAISGFTYYKDNKIWDEAPQAECADNTVNWDLSSIGVMEDGVKYSVEFHVWPKQEAYDLVADLNNKTIKPAELSELQKEEIQQLEDGSYGLKTNTGLTTKYTYNGAEQEDTPAYDEEVMPIHSYLLTLRKRWFNTLDADKRPAEPVQLQILKDGSEYLTTPDLNPVKESDESWSSNVYSFYIAPGFMIIKDDGSQIVLESGHDYSVQEPANAGYHWELTADTYHPMVINGALQLLKLKTAADGETGSSGSAGETVYTIKDRQYVSVPEAEAGGLIAENRRRSNLNLVKKVITAVDSTGTAGTTGAATEDNLDIAETPGTATQDISDSAELNGQKFSYSITVQDAGNQDVWFSVEDLADENKLIKDLTTNATAEKKDGTATGYYHIASDKELTVELEADWNLRFTNLLSGSSYSITETSMGESFHLKSITGPEGAAPALETGTISGTIGQANTSYQVTYINQLDTAEIFLRKEGTNAEDGKRVALDGAVFKLEKLKENASGEESTYEAVGEAFTINTRTEPNGYRISGLQPGTYRLTEITAPAGYLLLRDPIVFTVHPGTENLIRMDETAGTGASHAEISGDKYNTLTILNTPGRVLPGTGGYGTLLYNLGGLLLMIAALIFGIDSKRRSARN